MQTPRRNAAPRLFMDSRLLTRAHYIPTPTEKQMRNPTGAILIDDRDRFIVEDLTRGKYVTDDDGDLPGPSCYNIRIHHNKQRGKLALINTREFNGGVQLKKKCRHRVSGVVSCLIFMFSLCGAASFAQEKSTTATLYSEIAGDYEFELEGRVTVISFFVEDGVLMGKDSAEDPGTELKPVEGREMEFEATSGSGQLFQISFSRDESGKITKCLLVTLGTEIEGLKIKK